MSFNSFGFFKKKNPATWESQPETDATASAPASQRQPPPPAPISQPAVPVAVADPLADRFGKLRSALGPGTVIQGRLSFDTPVSIDGKLGGEVFSTKALYVGEQGHIDAAIEVTTLIVRGVVKGKIKVSEGIEILRGGRIDGDIITPKLRIDEGGEFTGKCSMPTPVVAKAEKIETIPTTAQTKESETKEAPPTTNKGTTAAPRTEARV